ncbi:7392_t:CDS:2 [Acaulospora colombiana]|uniref:7392_t:CDS:1 n=1 Tax=Acaulospora colombiana TaxID=27376 RepID=A0ACA9KQ03_9GLOM|nr:7392_t:CDS:2 [Acaulospora colombiana]
MPNSLPSPLPPKPETLREATSISMDRITQLQQSIDRMVSIFLTVVDKLNNTNLQIQDPQKFKSELRMRVEGEQQEIVQDICTNAKQIELLIGALPGLNRSEKDQIETFKILERELQEANEEYQRSVQNAGETIIFV